MKARNAPFQNVWLLGDSFGCDYAISYADALAAGAADHPLATLVTGDPGLARLHGRIPIEKLERISTRD